MYVISKLSCPATHTQQTGPLWVKVWPGRPTIKALSCSAVTMSSRPPSGSSCNLISWNVMKEIRVTPDWHVPFSMKHQNSLKDQVKNLFLDVAELCFNLSLLDLTAFLILRLHTDLCQRKSCHRFFYPRWDTTCFSDLGQNTCSPVASAVAQSGQNEMTGAWIKF